MMTKHNKIMILLGAIMLLAGLGFMYEPYYTWAQEQNDHPCRIALQPEEPLFEIDNMNPGDIEESSITVIKTGSSPAELYFAWEYVDGDPELGDEGSLFEQLEMTITSGDTELFKGPMSDWQYDPDNPSRSDAINITEKLEIDAIRQGEEVVLDFSVYLPGPETGNEYQGSSVTARLVFFTICTGNGTNGGNGSNGTNGNGTNGDNGTNGTNDDNGTNGEDETEPPQDDLDVDPGDPGVSPDPLPETEEPEEDPEDEEDDSSLIIAPEGPQVDPPLPVTDGRSLGLLIGGLIFLMAGIALKKSNKEQNEQQD